MMEEWDEHMADFVPNDMLSVNLNPREEIVSLNNNQLSYPFFFRPCMKMHPINRFILEEPTLWMLHLVHRKQIDLLTFLYSIQTMQSYLVAEGTRKVFLGLIRRYRGSIHLYSQIWKTNLTRSRLPSQSILALKMLRKRKINKSMNGKIRKWRKQLGLK